MNVLNAQARVGLLAIDADMPRLAGDCVGTDPAMWFADRPQRPRDLPFEVNWREPHEDKRERIAVMAEALAICRGCPVLAECREYTERHPELTGYGIWAATTGEQRRKRRGAQRRRRKAVANA